MKMVRVGDLREDSKSKEGIYIIEMEAIYQELGKNDLSSKR